MESEQYFRKREETLPKLKEVQTCRLAGTPCSEQGKRVKTEKQQQDAVLYFKDVGKAGKLGHLQ